MLKCVITLYEESQRAISDSPAEKRITWNYIKTTLSVLIQKVIDCKFLVSYYLLATSMKYDFKPFMLLQYFLRYRFTELIHMSVSRQLKKQDPKTPDREIKAHYDGIVKEIEDGFAALTDA